MLVWLANVLAEYYHPFQVINYLTLRAVLGVLTALVIAFIIGPYMIRYLKRYNVGQPVRDDGPQTHLGKQGTPTMGGLLIVISVALSTVLWVNLSNRFIWVALIVLVGFGLIGFIDDYRKVVLKNHRGLSAKAKFLGQSAIGLIVASFLYYSAIVPAETQLIVPFFKNVSLNLGLFYIFLTYCVVVGSSNAVNLTDGLDGLAILPCALIAAALGVFAYASGNILIAEYLGIPYIAGVGELVVICASIVGAGLGFLWFNTYPAQVFMGDVGALALGAVLGIIAVLVRQEIVFFVMAGVFVLETVSVILQVGYFKMTGKRIFRMAPLHHHYELKGWPEPRVIVRFWIITVILVLIGLATLKLR